MPIYTCIVRIFKSGQRVLGYGTLTFGLAKINWHCKSCFPSLRVRSPGWRFYWSASHLLKTNTCKILTENAQRLCQLLPRSHLQKLIATAAKFENVKARYISVELLNEFSSATLKMRHPDTIMGVYLMKCSAEAQVRIIANIMPIFSRYHENPAYIFEHPVGPIRIPRSGLLQQLGRKGIKGTLGLEAVRFLYLTIRVLHSPFFQTEPWLWRIKEGQIFRVGVCGSNYIGRKKYHEGCDQVQVYLRLDRRARAPLIPLNCGKIDWERCHSAVIAWRRRWRIIWWITGFLRIKTRDEKIESPG